ncbi:MAG: hypothetical protein A2Y33_07005 [Spirochaetes bacterium GWF1_51_8]|nr:MAG: hypothetical protein A2Y33_07005 [Spirochaetes bacterium GWF1_51_8]
MRLRLTLAALFVLGGLAALFAVTSKYLSDYKFDDVANYQLSNVCLVQNSGIELAHAYSSIYKTDKLIWSLVQHDGGYLMGTGDSASLVFLKNGESKEVFSLPKHLFFTDIYISASGITVSAIPDAKIVVLDPAYTPVKTIEFDNTYIWKIVPSGKGYYALAGDPAMVYYIENDEIKFSVKLEFEDNIIYGKIVNDTLYFCGEKALYKLDGQKAVAMIAFDNAVTGFDYFDGYLYVTTSSKDLYMDYNILKMSQGKGQNPDPNTMSVLYRVHPNGAFQKVFEKSGIRFIAVSHLKNSLIIGTDERGGYFELNTDYTRVKYTSLGKGKFLKFLETKDGLLAILLLPSEIVKIEEGYAKEGTYTSDIFDAAVVSEWGTPIIEKELMPGTDIKFLFRSGAVEETEYWGEWKSLKDKIACGPARFIQYMVKLTSDGKYTPFMKEVNIPYVEWNLPPQFKSLTYKYSETFVNIKWEAADGNNDELIYDLYIAMGEKGWVKLNPSPLKNPSYDIEYKAFPDGLYRTKVIVSDERSNPASGGKTNLILGESFYVDSAAPVVSPIEVKPEGGMYVFTFHAADSLLPVFKARYSINGAEWINILPVDGILDSKTEKFAVKIAVPSPSFVQFAISDVIGNISSAGVYVK